MGDTSPVTQYTATSEVSISTTTFPQSTTPEYRIVCSRCFCTNLPAEDCFRCKQDEEYNVSLNVDELKYMEDTTGADEQHESEITPVNIAEVRMHQIAYLSRNDPLDSLNETQDQSNAVSTVENSSPSTVIETLGPHSNNSYNVSSENFNSEATTVTVEQQELGHQQESHTSHPPSSPKEVQVIRVHRSRVCSDMVKYFQDEKITTQSMVF